MHLFHNYTAPMERFSRATVHLRISRRKTVRPRFVATFSRTAIPATTAGDLIRKSANKIGNIAGNVLELAACIVYCIVLLQKILSRDFGQDATCVVCI